MSAGAHTRVLVVASDGGVGGALTDAVDRAHGLVVAGVTDAIVALSGIVPACDLVLAAGLAEERLAAVIEAFGVPVVLVAEDEAGETLHRALASGARGVVSRPVDPNRLAAVARSATSRPRSAPGRPADGRVLAVCGAKGGVGATAIAVWLATAATALLIDLAPGHAPLADHVGADPGRDLSDLARLGPSVSADAVESVITTSSDGLRLIAGPSPGALWLLPGGVAPAVVRESRSLAAWTVLDLGVPAAPVALEAVAGADLVLLVTSPDRLGIAAACGLASRLGAVGGRPDAMRLAVNRWRRGGEFTLRAIERRVGIAMMGAVREDRRAHERYADRGRPLAGRRGAAADIVSLARRLELAA